VITASNIKNIKFEMRNNTLDQLQGMLAKMAANEIRTHARTNHSAAVAEWSKAVLRLRIAVTSIPVFNFFHKANPKNLKNFGLISLVIFLKIHTFTQRF